MIRSNYRCCCMNEPVIFSHCVHLKRGHRFHNLLKVDSDRDDTACLMITCSKLKLTHVGLIYMFLFILVKYGCIYRRFTLCGGFNFGKRFLKLSILCKNEENTETNGKFSLLLCVIHRLGNRYLVKWLHLIRWKDFKECLPSSLTLHVGLVLLIKTSSFYTLECCLLIAFLYM